MSVYYTNKTFLNEVHSVISLYFPDFFPDQLVKASRKGHPDEYWVSGQVLNRF